MTVGFSFDDEPTVNSRDESTVATSGSWYSWHGHPARAHGQDAHATVAVRTGERNHEMPGLPYPAFRMLNAEPGGGPAWRDPPRRKALRTSGGARTSVLMYAIYQIRSKRRPSWLRTHGL